MQRTPHLTYLAERMQSARGLGWDFNPTANKTSHTSPRSALLRFTFVRSMLLRLTSPTTP
jgi:hypothetical protein